MKRRYYLKNKKRFAISILLAILIVFTFLYVASVYGYKEKISYNSVYVKKGDTLWDIAEKYKQSGDIRKYIKEIKKINNLESSTIFEGDILKIPN